jgi:ABC-2 type transport system ATP-binding protein
VANIIEVSGVEKTYGGNFTLRDINLNIKEGSVFALLGLNGAGKTTLVKLMLNLLNVDRGTLSINGINVLEAKSRKNVAFIPEKFSFFSFYTVYGALEFFGQMKGLEGAELESQINQAMNDLNIFNLRDRKIKTLSKGQMQRIGLCNLIIGNNNLLILDEPFSGLDPIGMSDLRDLIRKLKSEGKTIFMNSHILSEMEQICDEVAIIHDGVIKVQKPVSEILNEFKSLEDFFTHIIPRN